MTLFFPILVGIVLVILALVSGISIFLVPIWKLIEGPQWMTWPRVIGLWIAAAVTLAAVISLMATLWGTPVH